MCGRSAAAAAGDGRRLAEDLDCGSPFRRRCSRAQYHSRSRSVVAHRIACRRGARMRARAARVCAPAQRARAHTHTHTYGCLPARARAHTHTHGCLPGPTSRSGSAVFGPPQGSPRETLPVLRLPNPRKPLSHPRSQGTLTSQGFPRSRPSEPRSRRRGPRAALPRYLLVDADNPQ